MEYIIGLAVVVIIMGCFAVCTAFAIAAQIERDRAEARRKQQFRDNGMVIDITDYRRL